MSAPTLSDVFWRCATLSLVAVGGANAVLPELHRQTVVIHQWLTSAEFATLFAIAAAAPGPNVLVVTLIGWKLCGLPGALAATLGMCGPSSLLALGVGRVWERQRHARWRAAVEQGLAPITVGLVLGSGWLLAQGAVVRPSGWLLLAAVGGLGLRLRLNPLWFLVAGALLGAVGGV